MKLAIIGAGGVRTPLLIQALHKRQEQPGYSAVIPDGYRPGAIALDGFGITPAGKQRRIVL